MGSMDGLDLEFDAGDLLSQISVPRMCSNYQPKQLIYSQGDPADAVFYIRDGRVKLSAVSRRGKQAVIAVLGKADFFGEGCLVGQDVRFATATALTGCSILRIEKKLMIKALREEKPFAYMLASRLILRTLQLEDSLADRFFNSSERRLARTLLLLARAGKDRPPTAVIPRISQETLAAMVGTTRSRIGMFLKKFETSGYIDYDGGLRVHCDLLDSSLRD